MVELWRLTRNQYGRSLYDGLAALGVTATWMLEYARELDDTEATDRTGPDTVETCDPERLTPLEAPVSELLEDEVVVGAFEDGAALGYLFCSFDAEHDIEPLERSLAFDGAYVRRVFVAPEARQRGVGSALLGTACEWATAEGADRITALVARDNVPSRRLFERHEFEVVRDRRYVRIGPWSSRSVGER